MVTEQGLVVPGVSQPTQLTKFAPPVPVAVNVTVDPLLNALANGPGLAPLRPAGLLVTVPAPLPENVRVSALVLLPPPPLPVKHATLPVMNPVTTAPEEEIPPALVFVVAVADTSVPPHENPVTVTRPEESTVIIWGVFEAQVT